MTVVYGPGLVFHSTAGHGGFELSAARWKRLRGILGPVKSYAGEGWLEEDCDWALAAIALSEWFTDAEIFSAFLSIKTYQPGPYARGLALPGMLERMRAYYAAAAKHLRTGCFGSAGPKAEEAGFAWSGTIYTLDDSLTIGFASREYPSIPDAATVETLPANIRILTRHETAAKPFPLELPKPPAARAPERDPWEMDFGGVFDGVSVTSDADPGL